MHFGCARRWRKHVRNRDSRRRRHLVRQRDIGGTGAGLSRRALAQPSMRATRCSSAAAPASTPPSRRCVSWKTTRCSTPDAARCSRATALAELDASVMDGRTLSAGAVTGLKHVKNPIALARRVMDHSPHVMLVGAGAEEFARLQGVELVSNEYFRTPVRQAQLHRLLGGTAEKENDLVAFGTVGAVALDASRQSRGRHVHRRHDGQTLGPRRRLAHHRRRHLREQRELRGVGHRAWRILHPRGGRARHLRAGGIPETAAGAGCRAMCSAR